MDLPVTKAGQSHSGNSILVINGKKRKENSNKKTKHEELKIQYVCNFTIIYRKSKSGHISALNIIEQ